MTRPSIWKHYRHGPFLVFQDEDTEVLRVGGDDISNVVLTDMPGEDRT